MRPLLRLFIGLMAVDIFCFYAIGIVFLLHGVLTSNQSHYHSHRLSNSPFRITGKPMAANRYEYKILISDYLRSHANSEWSFIRHLLNEPSEK